MRWGNRMAGRATGGRRHGGVPHHLVGPAHEQVAVALRGPSAEVGGPKPTARTYALKKRTRKRSRPVILNGPVVPVVERACSARRL
jgi:hypothetical protein